MLALKSRNLLAVILIVSFAFCCAAAWQSIFFSPTPAMSSAHCGAASAHRGTICLSTAVMMPAMTSSFVLFMLCLLVLMLLVVLSRGWWVDRALYYIRSIRDHFGQLTVFNNLASLFSQGILHPKIF